MQEFNSNKIAATLLGAKNLPSLNIEETTIKQILYKLEKKVNSLKVASKILTRGIDQENIYVVPIKTDISNEVTQFAKIFKRKLSQKLDVVDVPNEADYILRGSYDVLKGEMFVSIKLLDKNNKVIKSANIMLDKKAYAKYKYIPKTKSIDEVLQGSNISNGELEVQIAFKGYKRANAIDLNDGDIIDIYAKTNKDICYFLEGITVSKGKTSTYLIERENGTFKSFIEGDKVNRTIPILENIEVSKPFGDEKVIMFAQTLQNGKCHIPIPSCKTDKQTDLCLIIDAKTKKRLSPSKSINTTRSLFSQHHKKNHTTKKVENAEATIHFTTFE